MTTQTAVPAAQPLQMDTLTQAEARALVRLARRTLEAAYRGDTACVEGGPGPAEQVNVTIRVRGQVRGSMSGNGSTLREQIRDAALRSAVDSRFDGPLAAHELPGAVFEIWIRRSARQIEHPERADWFDRGVDGVELSLGPRRAYYKPSVALTKDYANVADLLGALARKAKLPEDAWRDPRARVLATRWDHYVECPGDEAAQLFGLRPARSEEHSEAALESWVDAGARYLMANQWADGSYTYRYLPFTNQAVSGPVHLVRAAGCAYAMAWAAGGSRSRSASACSAVHNLLSKAAADENGALLVGAASGRRQDANLGATALLAVALQSDALRDRFAPQCRGLLIAIAGAQRTDGSFRCDFADGSYDGGKMNFYPGQALLALALQAERGDAQALARCEAAFEYYALHFRQAPATAFPLWQIDAWRRVFACTGQHRYAAFVFEQADFLAALQNLTPGTRAFGSISGPGKPPGTTTSVYAEAVARALGVARSLGDTGRAERYRQTVLHALGFVSQLVFTEAQTAFFADPARAIGGVSEELGSFEVRSDFVQHLITLALAVLQERP